MKSMLLYLACVTLGLGLGIAYLFVLPLHTRVDIEGGIGGRAPLLHAVRLLVTGAAFLWLAQYGALPALLALLGFLVARQPLLRQALFEHDAPRGSL